MAQKEAIMRALMEAMGSSAPMTSKRPMARPKAGMGRAGASLMGESGKTISDADRRRIMGMMASQARLFQTLIVNVQWIVLACCRL